MSLNPADPAFGLKPVAPLSITARLAVLYTASTYVMLLATTAFLYLVVMSGLEQDDVYFLVDKVHRVEWALQHHPDDLSFLDHEVKWEGGPKDFEAVHSFYSRILDDQGRLLIETPGMAKVIPSARFGSPVDPELSSRSEMMQRWRSPEGRNFCLLSVRARDGQIGQSWVIQVALDDPGEEVTIDNVRRLTFVALLLGTLFSAGLGTFVARRGMKPLREIALTAERITANQLKERVDTTRQPKELALLATALNRMLGRLEDSFVRMSQFAEDVAHELRTPIHNMMGEAEVTLATERRPEEYRRILESSLEEFHRLSRMITEMLFLARAENPQQQIERVRLDARREIEAVREFFDALTESHGVKIVAKGQGCIDGDPILFRRAITNLLSNALRHTPMGGQIVLAVERVDEGAILVEVSDSGCGITPEHVPRVCDRLYCADRTNTQLSEHTGLGLSIVKSIVELHGGSIAIESALGKGTTVQMRFPAATTTVA